MRVSVEKDDVGYEAFYQAFMDGFVFKILFNREDVSGRCYTADEELKIVKLAKLDQGRVFLENDEVATETISGEVVIEKIERVI